MTTSAKYAYISGPLQAAHDLAAARAFYERLGQVCEQHGWPAYLPHQQSDPEHHAEAEPREIFELDYIRLVGAAMIVAHIGAPSSGVGAELGIALERGIPLVTLHARDERPSRLVLGLVQALGAPRLVYEDVDDCVRQLAATLDGLHGSQTAPERHAEPASGRAQLLATSAAARRSTS